MKRKVLIVSFLFPPAENIGALRVGKLAKYLPEFGWEPIILTVNKVQDSQQTMPLEIAEPEIKRTPYFTYYSIAAKWLIHDEQISEPNLTQQGGRKKNPWKINANALRWTKGFYSIPIISRWLLDPMGWYSYAVKAGLEIVNKNNIDIIYSSFPPSTSHMIASRLHRQTKIPWVAEFRDPWSMNRYLKQTQPFHLFEVFWEKRTLKNCEYIVDVSETLAKVQRKLHSKNTIVIPNGFDEADYSENVPPISKFCITYTGNIIVGKTDPSPLFRALAELNQEKKITPKEIELRFFGNNFQPFSSLIDDYGIKEYVKIFGFVPLKKSIEKQKESTVLLFMSWNDPRGAGTLSGKLHEYIGAGKPILALSLKGGEIYNLLQETGCGVIVNDVSEIKSVLLKWLKEFNDEGKIISFYHPNKDNIKKYTRREQARKLAELFEKVHSNIIE